MGAALQVINCQATNPGATVTTLTPNTGDSLTIRSTDMSSDIELLNAWAFTTTNLLLRLRSPRMHDQAQNMRYQPTASQPYPLMPMGETQKLYSQDPLTFEITGGTAEVDIGALLVYYNNLPGISARLHGISEITPLVKNLTTIEVDVTSSGTSGNYSATVAANGTYDTLVRNVDYAILGYECATTGCSLGITGVDTGNLRVGGPLLNTTWFTSHWFYDLSFWYGKSLIPVFNSANVAGLLLDCVAQATSTSFKVGLNLAQLSSNLPD